MANTETAATVNTEMTAVEAKLPWYKRLWYNRKVRTGLKIGGGVLGAGACALGGFALGRSYNPSVSNGETESDDDED